MSEINEFQRWGNKKAYDEGWLRLWGKECPVCHGHGEVSLKLGVVTECARCEGHGRIEKEKCGVCEGKGYCLDKSPHGEEIRTVCINCNGKGKC